MIIVMRHGESTVNVERRLTCRVPHGDLTETGREQAVRAAAWLKNKGVKRIWTSPFHRAQQTAAIIGEVLGVEPSDDVDLAEMDCGELEGRTDNDAWQAWSGIFARWLRAEWDAAFPGGETYRDAYERLHRTLNRSAEQRGVTLLVTHGGITRAVIPYLCVNAAALQRVESLGNTGMILLEPYDPGRFACESWNLVDHLR
jgi:probable phosphoglycerate mutase